MMNAIARWHSKARPALGDLEQAYADRLEGEMQEMGVQLQMVKFFGNHYTAMQDCSRQHSDFFVLFYFFPRENIDSCKSSAYQMLCMKYQALFSQKKIII